MKILDFAQIPYVIYIGNLSKIYDFQENPPDCVQIDLSQCSGGVCECFGVEIVSRGRDLSIEKDRIKKYFETKELQ